MTDTPRIPAEINPVEPPMQFDSPEFAFDLEIDRFLMVPQARQAFGVTGNGLTVAVLDTGLNTTHIDFAGRVVAQRNFTPDNNNNADDATDGNGHGTNVGGIIVANGDHKGIAPAANIIPLKVLRNTSGGSFVWIEQALDWVIENRVRYNISAVCMSLGDGQNYTAEDGIPYAIETMQTKIRTLKAAQVAVVIAAGNDFFPHHSQQGMSYPAILRECVSVGAVYDADEGGFQYHSGAIAYSSKAGQITPFSQRLHPTKNSDTYTDIFAPGAPVTSSGINGPHGESIQHGTSQATPVIVGVILLMQEFYRRATGQLPEVDDLVTWLRRGGAPIYDGDDEHDNVQHTHLEYIRVDALSAVDAVRRHLQKQLLEKSIATS